MSKYHAWDITLHLDFPAWALVAQDGGLDVGGYIAQVRFLMNCGLLPLMQAACHCQRIGAQRLLHQHEPGESFKLIVFARSLPGIRPMGFAVGDRTHTL